jgi:hypothetical protein
VGHLLSILGGLLACAIGAIGERSPDRRTLSWPSVGRDGDTDVDHDDDVDLHDEDEATTPRYRASWFTTPTARGRPGSSEPGLPFGSTGEGRSPFLGRYPCRDSSGAQRREILDDLDLARRRPRTAQGRPAALCASRVERL